MRVVIETKKRVGYDGHYAVIVPDCAAGATRYTVYLLPAHAVPTSHEAVKIIGRELPLLAARRVAIEASGE